MAEKIKHFNQVFSDNLKAIMFSRDIRQSELARMMGVSTATMSDWCNGNKTPRPAHIDKLCQYLNCTRAALMLDPVQRPLQTGGERVPFERDDYNVIVKFLQLNNESKRFIESMIDRELERQ